MSQYQITEENGVYLVGNFRVEQDGEYWKISGGTLKDGHALFSEKSKALSWANLMFTCGELVSTGTRQVLTILATDQGAK